MFTSYLATLPWHLLGTVFASGFIFGLAFALTFFVPSHPRPTRKE